MRYPLAHVAIAGIAAVALSIPMALAADKSNSSDVDDLLIAAQKICSVTGQKLGSMGKPLKSKSDDQIVFLCCKGCVGKKGSEANWKKITANQIAAQAKCPVDNMTLDDKAQSVVVEHRRVFVCSDSCLEKVNTDPGKYIAIVNDLLKENVERSKQHG